MGKWEGNEGQKFVHMARIRVMVRLIELQLENKIPESEWKEIQSLTMNKTMKKRGTEFYEGAEAIVTGLRHFTVTDLSETEILDLLFAVRTFICCTTKADLDRIKTMSSPFPTYCFDQLSPTMTQPYLTRSEQGLQWTLL